MQQERDDGPPERGQQGGNQNHPQPQQGKKCPRCDSVNTKFCYYNNYSLSQPRYFCKTCRRYWTQGGTLRNVPVGGGCRKGKRVKTSNSVGNSNPQPPPPPQPSSILHAAQPIIGTTTPSLISTNANIFPSLGNSYHQSGSFLSSLAAIQSLNAPQSFSQLPINVGSGPSNMAMLQGFNVPNFVSQPNQQREFFEMGDKEKNVAYEQSLTNPPLSRGTTSSWQQSFISSAADGMWSINNSASSSSSKKNGSSSVGASLNQNQWLDLPGYGSPPP